MRFSAAYLPGAPFPIAPVPEPEIYAMMGVGLGIMGWVARKKKRKLAAI